MEKTGGDIRDCAARRNRWLFTASGSTKGIEAAPGLWACANGHRSLTQRKNQWGGMSMVLERLSSDIQYAI